MAGPKYLTGDSAGIKEFLDKFDVRHPAESIVDCPLTQLSRSSSSTAMVCGSPPQAPLMSRSDD